MHLQPARAPGAHCHALHMLQQHVHGVWTRQNEELRVKLTAVEMDTKLRAQEKNALLPAEQTSSVKLAVEIDAIKRQIADMGRATESARAKRVLAGAVCFSAV